MVAYVVHSYGKNEVLMQEKKPESRTVCDKIVKTFLDQLATIRGCEEISVRLEKAILNEKPTEAAIRSALFDEEVP